MKGKFKLLGHLGVALFLVSALMLAFMPAAPVQAAATAVTDVWVEFPAEDAGENAVSKYNLTGAETLYRIHFKATTALVRGVDKIIVQFPDGVDTDMGPADAGTYAFTLGAECGTPKYYDIDADAAGTTYGYYDATTANTVTAASYGGYRITVTIGVDIAAGSEAWLLIDDEPGMVIGGAESTTAYKVYVHTSKDTTPVLSKGFYLGSGNAIADASASSISPTEAGATNVEYTFTFQLTTELPVADTITVTFPYGTTLPSSMAASSITVYNAGGGSSTTGTYTCGVSPTIDTDLRRVIVTMPAIIGTNAGAKLKFATTCGITNPTFAYAEWGAITTKSRVGYIHTSKDMKDTPLYKYEITHAGATNVDFDYTAGTDKVTGASDKYTMINMYSSPLYLQVEDQYGNVVKTGTYATVYITLEKTSATGVFYNITGGDYTQITGTQALSGGAKTIYYKDTTAGTYTLTASYTGLESCNWTFQVCPGVALYDKYDNLIHTYAPTSTTPVEETAAGSTPADYYLASHYIMAALNDATAYDQVVLGDGHYETNEHTNNRMMIGATMDYVTLKSLNGADYTTIDARNIVTGKNIILVEGGADYITIEDLTFQGNKTVGWGIGICCENSDGFTFQNNKFIDIPADAIAVYPFKAGNPIDSGTITNNTITGIGRGHGGVVEIGAIRVQSAKSNAVTAVKITNNIISDCYGCLSPAIVVNNDTGETGDMTAITVQGNIISDCYCGIHIEDWVTGLTGTKAIANNSITGCVMGVKVKDDNRVAFDLVKNTITDNKLYGIYFTNATLAAQTIDIKYNDISGNGKWGIYNTYTATGEDVIAKYNWWGDATGPGPGESTDPYVNLTAVGSGDNVSCEATYEPWLHKPLADVVADNASYQACTMKLALGCWNTLSTPVKLIEAADAIDELISADDMTIGYYYDAGWQVIETGYVLSPCDAVYIKMKSTASTAYVLLKFDAGAFSTASKELKVGWNMFSLAYLSSSGKRVDRAVASVLKTAANLPGYSHVISPSMNASQTDLFGTTGTIWTYSSGQALGGTTNTMYPGLGYWIYMQNPCTLVGFEITPIAPAFGLD